MVQEVRTLIHMGPEDRNQEEAEEVQEEMEPHSSVYKKAEEEPVEKGQGN